MQIIVPLLACLVSLTFAFAVLDQFLLRRHDFMLYWAVGLFAWAAGTFGEFLAEAFGFHAFPFRLWYVGGAVMTAAWMGMGSLALLAGRRRWVDVVLGALILGTLIAALRVFTAPVDLAPIRDAGHLTGEALPEDVRLLTPFFNVFGTSALVGVAIWSAVAFMRSRSRSYRVQANLLIAAGSFLPAFGGSLEKLGSAQVLYLTELLGALVIFAGFLRTQENFRFYPFLFFRQKLDRVGLPEGLQ